MNKFLKRFWKKEEDRLKNMQIAFGTAICMGLVTHLFVYTNILTNYDGLSRVYDEQQMTVSGRWFLHYASALDGYLLTPMTSGIMAMLFLALSIALTIDLLGIKTRGCIIVWACIAVVYPTVAYTNTFTFTIAAYGFSVFLSVFSVWIVKRTLEKSASGKNQWKIVGGILVSALMTAFSMGIYQAYVAISISLSVLMVIRYILLYTEEGPASVWRYGLIYVGYLLLAAILYYIILLISLRVKSLELLSYRGMDQMGNGIGASLLLKTLIKTLKESIAALFRVGSYYNTKISVICNVLILIAIISLFGKVIANQKLALWRFGHLIVLVFLLPIVMNFGQMISPYSSASPTMMYGLALYYLIAAWGADLSLSFFVKKEAKEECRNLKIVATLMLTIGINALIFAETDNKMYTVLAQAHRASQAFMTNLLGRIESYPGYTMGTEIVIVGGFPSDRYYSDVETYEELAIWGIDKDSILPKNKHMYYYLEDWINTPICEPDEDVFFQVTATEQFRQMPLYPDDGSIQQIDGRIVVKLQQEYTPKEQYELDYEKRH